jgi:hypothetical protein
LKQAATFTWRRSTGATSSAATPNLTSQDSELALHGLNRFEKSPRFSCQLALALIQVRNTRKVSQDGSVGDNGLGNQLSGVIRVAAPGLSLRKPQVGKREVEIGLQHQAAFDVRAVPSV